MLAGRLLALGREVIIRVDLFWNLLRFPRSRFRSLMSAWWLARVEC